MFFVGIVTCNPVTGKPSRSERKCRVVKWKWGLFSTELHTSTTCQHQGQGGIFSNVGLDRMVSGCSCSGFNKRNSLVPLSISTWLSDEFKTQGNRTWPSSSLECSEPFWENFGGGEGGTASLPANGDLGKSKVRCWKWEPPEWVVEWRKRVRCWISTTCMKFSYIKAMFVFISKWNIVTTVNI